VFVKFIVDESGYIVNPTVVRGVHTSLDKSAMDAISTMPRWKPGRIEGKAVDVPMTFPIRFSLDGSGLSMASNAENPYLKERAKEFEKNMTDSLLKKAAVNEVSYYILNTSELGWINCDRFINTETVPFRIYAPSGGKDELDVKLIFEKRKSVLPGTKIGEYFHFPNIPKNEHGIILALRATDHGLEMCSKKVILNTNRRDSLLSFEPVTVTKLKDYLDRIDKN
jgi:hypothetical protein